MKEYLKSKLDTLTEDQKSLFNDMLSNILLQVCIPTGAGKGYLMMIDLLNQIVSTKNKLFVVSTHRLMLNTQHLNDIFSLLSPMIGEIGYIFVGSSKYDVSKFQDNVAFNKALLDKKLSYNEILSSTTNSKEVNELVKNHIANGRKVVILTTYHSLNTLKDLEIDTFYGDEAQTLASDEFSRFQENFESINAKRTFFFTATPKDCTDKDTEAFLMNNEEVFGERVGLNFKHCVDNGYLVKPIIHICKPSDYDDKYDYKNIDNLAKFVDEAFFAHRNFIKSVSLDETQIEPKMLVKCASVDDMWDLHERLNGTIEGVKICAGASRNDKSTHLHYIGDEGIKDRSEYLQRVQEFEDTEMAIVLHYDTMSEGINVAGFTGVMFLGGKLPTITKTLQNTGRSTRLHPLDRVRFRNGEIKVGDGNWIKPNCAVIIPFYDRESEFTSRELAKQIRGLRDDFGYDPTFYVSIGTEIGSGKSKDDLDYLNEEDERQSKFDLIDQITHEIEVLDNEAEDLKEKERLNSMPKKQLLLEKLKKPTF